MAKKLKYLIIHCSATPKDKYFDKKDILEWHCSPKPRGRGWSKPGYTDLILLDGTLQNLTPFDQDDEVDGFEVTNGVRGINSISRHICYIGGMDETNQYPEDTRTTEQREVLTTYIRYMVARHPDIIIAGHNQFSNKACPSFDVPEYLDYCFTIPEKNIYRG